MIEQRTFRIHELDDLDLLGDKLDEAFEAGWQYVSHLSVGRGVMIVLARTRQSPEYNDLLRQAVLSEKKKPAKAGAR